MSTRESISAFVICCNEEAKIRRCLESVKWCDELIVVDSGSTDKTLKICGEYTNSIFHKDWTGFVAQKQFALSKCSKDWVLNIDADEEVSHELQKEIQEALTSKQQVDGYLLSRVVFHLGKWWKKGGWYPEHRLRLCRRSKVTWGGADPHEKASVEGRVQKLQGDLHHYTYGSIAEQVQSLNSLSSAAAQTLAKEGEGSGIKEIIFRPWIRFVKFYFFKKGFKEGFPGLIVAILEAFYVFLKYVKLWEIRRRERLFKHSAPN